MAYTLIKVSKLDAARRQLQTAIELWFHAGDQVSIHSLACAAYEIIHDLNRRAKGPPLYFDTDWIKDEFRKEYINLVKRPGNFFKHADFRKDKAESLDLNPALAEGFILFAVRGLHFLGKVLTDTEAAYLVWTVIHKPHLLKPEGRELFFKDIPIEGLNNLRRVKKGKFFNAYLCRRKWAYSGLH